MAAFDEVITRFIMQAMGEDDEKDFMLDSTAMRVIIKDPTFVIGKDRLLEWASKHGAEVSFTRRKAHIKWE